MACAVRLYGLAFHSLWLDEAASVYLGSFRYSETFLQGVSLQHPNPPQYHLMVSAWARPFETGEAAVRLVSVFAGTVHLARSPQSERVPPRARWAPSPLPVCLVEKGPLLGPGNVKPRSLLDVADRDGRAEKTTLDS